MIDFGDLTLTRTRIIRPSGQMIRVPLLPVSAVAQFEEITAPLAENATPGELTAARAALRELCLQVYPAEYAEDLMRLPPSGLIMLCETLITGRDPAKESEKCAAKGGEFPDFQFLAAVMLNVYHGYTLDTLFALPLPVFMRLLELVSRVRADCAKREVAIAIDAALNGSGYRNLLDKLRGQETINPAPKTASYTQEQLDEAIARFDQPMTVVKRIKIGDPV